MGDERCELWVRQPWKFAVGEALNVVGGSNNLEPGISSGSETYDLPISMGIHPYLPSQTQQGMGQIHVNSIYGVMNDDS